MCGTNRKFLSFFQFSIFRYRKKEKKISGQHFFSPAVLRISPEVFLDFFRILIEFDGLIAKQNNLNCGASHLWDTLSFSKKNQNLRYVPYMGRAAVKGLTTFHRP